MLALVAAFAAIHAYRQYVASDDTNAWMLSTFAFVPGRFTYSVDPAGVSGAISSLTGPDAAIRREVARFFLGDGQPLWWTPLTYAGIHADWTHDGVNSLWLLAFGAPVARRLGSLRFLGLFVVAAIAGALAHWATHPLELEPVIGASASVSGAMAAAIRFVFQPGAPLGLGGGADDTAFRRPAMPLTRVFSDRRTLSFLIMWFGLNLLFGLVSAPLGMTSGPVAWEAHVGGFLAGLLLFPLFDPPAPEDIDRSVA